METAFGASPPLFVLAGHPVGAATALAAVSGLAIALLAVVLVMALRAGRSRRAMERTLTERAGREAEQMAAIERSQTEMQGRMATMAELFGSRQADLNRAINERLDGMSERLGTSMSEQTKATHANLTKLQERLAVIDTAQSNIQSLAKDVVGLQAILANKQTRGAFGQGRMETIVADALPKGAYTFQATLSNGSRPDCTVKMPNDAPVLAIDAKFPLEAWNAMREAEGEDHAEARRNAALRFRRDMDVHIRAIAGKYLIQGETQDTAFLFVPSEAIFADLHETFGQVVERAHKARIVIVSPSLLMLSIQVIQAILKDQRMREQAHLIQGEVGELMADLNRLDDRVRKLQSHFGQSEKDIEQIVISTEKLTRRGARIEALDFKENRPKADANGAGEDHADEEEAPRLRLRSVELR
ncbi:DNA recombination protein RmuC [Pararhizobium mangrovi]|uniref:DNA recombination protein RmuC homolog n=1 Tax=Pararhizobium mangrovi TaxID=2590452 RepID=A0A506U2R8_9HYPH|nr:DNA recombination protein RmuC [Pararhizobium mangrovi]TPW28662.1 DNA recombination protein RmuC [Pararhizobium mangrovi]